MIRAVRGDEDAWLERVFPDGVRVCTSSTTLPGIFCEHAHRLYFLFLVCLVILMVAVGHRASPDVVARCVAVPLPALLSDCT
jgi:hypothetical protein